MCTPHFLSQKDSNLLSPNQLLLILLPCPTSLPPRLQSASLLSELLLLTEKASCHRIPTFRPFRILQFKAEFYPTNSALKSQSLSLFLEYGHILSDSNVPLNISYRYSGVLSLHRVH